MSKFTSQPTIISRTPAEISERFGDLRQFQTNFDGLPEEVRVQVSGIKFDVDSVTIPAPQIGEIKFAIVERTPEKIVFEGQGVPMPMTTVIDLKPVGNDQCELTTSLDIQIPMMLKPFISGPLQKAVDKFTTLFVAMAQKD